MMLKRIDHWHDISRNTQHKQINPIWFSGWWSCNFKTPLKTKKTFSRLRQKLCTNHITLQAELETKLFAFWYLLQSVHKLHYSTSWTNTQSYMILSALSCVIASNKCMVLMFYKLMGNMITPIPIKCSDITYEKAKSAYMSNLALRFLPI